MANALMRSWAPVYTASRWVTVLGAMRDMLRGRGNANAMTNAEAAAFVREWSDVSDSPSSLWSQFAAVAYGWNPPRDTLNKSAAQAAGWYRMTPEVFDWADGIARELDDRHDLPPRIAVNKATFSDPVFYGSVRAQLQQDGAQAAFKIPLPSCTDKKTGKSRFPRPRCDKNGHGPLLGMDKSGRPIYGDCDKPGDCKPDLVDDPLTHAGNQLTTLLLVLGAVWLLTRKQPHRGNR